MYKLIGDQVMESDLVGTDYEGANKALTRKVAFIKVLGMILVNKTGKI